MRAGTDWRTTGRLARRATAGKANRYDPFDVEAFGRGRRDIIMRRRLPGDVTRLVRWTRQRHWSAQIVLALGAVAIGALALVFGLAGRCG